METITTLSIFVFLLAVVAVPYWRKASRHQVEAHRKLEKSRSAGMTAPVTLHPHIDLTSCIGCASCVKVCPENVLGIVDGRAAIVSGLKCIGHAVCADVCPVGAITMGFGTPSHGMEIPYYDERFQTNIKGLYVIGELGGIGLIRNAVTQALTAVNDVLSRPRNRRHPETYDLVIVGAGPAGLAAALGARAAGLHYVVLEQDDIGGTILHYPRRKVVLTKPVDLPLHGRLKFTEITKEDLLALWLEIVDRFSLNILTHRKVDSIVEHDRGFLIASGDQTIRGSNVMLALGRRGSPRKLGVKGEELPKVMYRLLDAESYTKKKILVVGGGDSAIEAAMGLASQRGNTVTLSYRRDCFLRLKEKNEQRINEYVGAGRIRAVFNSQVTEIRSDAVILQERDNILHTLPNDFVFVFAGGELPSELLKKAGIQFRTSDAEARAA
jgi:putative YpdA family bacillithiol system oxidoreductase